MPDEATASKAFVDALHGRSIPVAEIQRISRKSGPQNHLTLATAALVKKGEATAAQFDALIPATPNEMGSHLYDKTWNLCTYAVIDSDRAREVYSAMLATAALCLVPAETIELHDLDGRHPRPRDHGMDQYRGPICGMAGQRIVWNDHEASTQCEKAIVGALAAWALGQSCLARVKTPKPCSSTSARAWRRAGWRFRRSCWSTVRNGSRR